MARAARLFLPIILLWAILASAQTSAPPATPSPNPGASQSFDVKAAVEAYLAKMPARGARPLRRLF